MPYGAHETMEAHEVLLEKINMITHFNLYAQETRNPQLLDMIVRHQQEEIATYNELVACTRGSNRFNPIPSNTNIRGINSQQIQYGMNNTPQFAPQPDAAFNDAEIACAMLMCHKNSARNCAWAALECADPNLRRIMLNCAATCSNQAYEVFLFMNEQGMYPVPTLNNQMAETFLNRYQPASASLEAQYGLQSGQNAMGYPGGSNNLNFSAGSRNSVLYGEAGGGNSYASSMQQ